MDSVYGPGTLYCAECGRPTASDELARFGDLLVCPECKDRYAQKLREGVAPAISFEYGGFWIRFLAVIIDGIILMVVGTILQYALLGNVGSRLQPPAPGTPPEQFLGLFLGILGIAWALNTLIDCLYQSLFIGYLGATPGKMALSLKVVRPDGGPVGLPRAFGRYFAKILSGLILGIGYIMAGFDSQKRALHDQICDTRVIKTRQT
jgi:uncharacterized RDD family membrane protein YckC